MKPNRLSGCDGELLRDGYEQLRRDALGNSATGGMKGKGLVLVFAQRHVLLDLGVE